MKKSNWILFLVNGLIAIIFGLLALFVPGETIKLFTVYFGWFILFGGLLMFYFSWRNMKAHKSYSLLMAEAIFAILVGAVIAFYPTSSLKIFLILIGIWATIIGLLQIIVAVQMKKKVKNHSLFSLNGVITLVFGLLLFFNPLGSIKALFMVIGLLALVAGVFMLFLAFKVRAIKE